MRTSMLADAAGVILMTSFAALPFSCVPTASATRENLQPLVAATGAYSVMESPEPAPVPTVGCEQGCKCNGTGREKSGDGLADVDCRCPITCACKSRKASVSTHGRPGWPPKNLAR
jgi:hypothetical protein